jgi:O-antigen/teichoic acid export membrane protein
MMAAAPVAIPLALGHQWDTAVPVIQLLAVVSLVRAADIPRAALVLAAGRAALSFYYNLIVLLVLSCTVAAAVYWGTIITVATGLLIAHLFLNAIVYFMAVRPVIGHCYFAYLSSIAYPIIAAALMAAALTMAQNSRFIDNQPILLAWQVISGALFYIALIHVGRRDQLKDLASILPRRFIPKYLQIDNAYPA